MEKNDFILIRHGYDDHSYIDGKNDTNLTTDGIKMAKKRAKKLLFEINNNDTIVRHSAKIRAQETAEIICEELVKNNINCQCIKDHGLTELLQGEFNFYGLTHKERIDFLQSCWDDFELCRKNKEFNHKFGQNKNRSIIITPGETHNEWATRIANGVLNIINDLDNSYQSINITHRGAILEIQKIIELGNGLILPDQVEEYQTIWMEYCQDYKLHINDLEKAKILTKDYLNKRSQYENNN